MALINTKFLSLYFLLLTLLSLQTHARDSQFFSKVTNINHDDSVKQTEQQQQQNLPNKEETVTVVTKPDEEPNFTPQSKNGYGLYGHESNELPSTTANGEPTTTSNSDHTTYAPYVTPITHPEEFYRPDQEAINRYRENFNSHYNSASNNNNYYYNSENPQNGVRGYSTMQENSLYNNNGGKRNVNNGERQGMSDTRFMENGKYFYDINSENNFESNQYGNSRVVESRNNWANNKGYFDNNDRVNHHQNNMPHDSFQGFQNEEFSQNEEEFQP